MGSVCARNAPTDVSEQPPAALAWSRKNSLGNATTMHTQRPTTVSPQPLVRPVRPADTGEVQPPTAQHSDSGDDEYGTEVAHFTTHASTTGGSNGQLGGSLSGTSASFPHLVAIQHLRSQQQAEAQANSSTPRHRGSSFNQSKKMALFGGTAVAINGSFEPPLSPTGSFQDPTLTLDPPHGSAGNSLSQASLPGGTPRSDRDRRSKKEKREKKHRDGSHSRKDKRDKKERHHHHHRKDEGGATSMAESLVSLQSSGTSAGVVLSNSGGSAPSAQTHNDLRYTELDP